MFDAANRFSKFSLLGFPERGWTRRGLNLLQYKNYCLPNRTEAPKNDERPRPAFFFLDRRDPLGFVKRQPCFSLFPELQVTVAMGRV